MLLIAANTNGHASANTGGEMLNDRAGHQAGAHQQHFGLEKKDSNKEKRGAKRMDRT